MNIPGFTGHASLNNADSYRTKSTANDLATGSIVPAIPFCGNCAYILERCARNGWRPRAACNACAIGNCFSGVEHPPLDPFMYDPPRW